MARTYKDCPAKFKYSEFFSTRFRFPDGSWRDERLRDRAKKPKHKDVEWHWMTTPSWWTRLTMHRPKRRKCRVWEHNIRREQDFSEADCPDWGHKPHVYYW